MRYSAVRWLHPGQDFPVLLLSEHDDAGWEQRKVDVYRDGRVGFADAQEAHETQLACVRIPGLDDVAKEMAFDPTVLTREEFEHHWARRKSGGTDYWKSVLRSHGRTPGP
ncbi:DUF6881 domain-containing protein [Melittangium boletus]|uniref:DUF6881 domain-containing protein n=1 Tax=Melittangium boletus DSM 14713 TaxID=1294270 RepID=A0A250IJD5_9BACT|nr:hypothetical protein [Melittangium boletus]ATB31291.1 hypothetical protein MEBOL_004753 [Melittangium boletus DSM 14713]